MTEPLPMTLPAEREIEELARGSKEHTLRAMAHNYAGGHNWDHLDSEVCVGAANEITALKEEVERLENELHCANDLLADAQGEINQAEARGIERAKKVLDEWEPIADLLPLGGEAENMAAYTGQCEAVGALLTALNALKSESTSNGS